MGDHTVFYETHKQTLIKYLYIIKQELLEETVPFWEKRILDPVYPGYLTGYDRKGGLTDTRKHGWFVGRTMYMFGALYQEVEEREAWFQILKEGRRFMDGAFYAGGGRFRKTLSRDGQVLEGAVSIYTDHFLVKGLYQYVLALKSRKEPCEDELSLARKLTRALFRHVKDPAVLGGEGTPEGFRKHSVNFMNLVVALEARKLFGDEFDFILEDCVRRSLYEFAHTPLRRTFEYIGQEGVPVLKGPGRVMDAGHTMESLWFSMEAGRVMGKPEYGKRAEQVVDWVIENCYDEACEGFYQNVDVLSGIPEEPYRITLYEDIPVAWDDKIWWVQAEGLYTLAFSALSNENEAHFRYFERMFDYVERKFRDWENGEWYSILHRDGTMSLDAKGFALKGPYHVPRCLMQLMVLIESYLKGNENRFRP